MSYFIFDKKIAKLSKKAEEISRPLFDNIERIKEFNEEKVLKAFIKQKVSSNHFNSTTGYGYDDIGRDVLDKIFSDVFQTEDALVRHNFVNGTHALTVALFGILRPNDRMLCVTGKPYDTLNKVIDSNEDLGSLKNFGVKYSQVEFKNDDFDFDSIKKELKKDVKVVYVQRSKGYSLRKSLSCENIKKLSLFIKEINKNIVIICDNCYCEFTEKAEPTGDAADLIVGSLIKNPGGGIVSCGGYIAGKKNLIEKCSYRLTIPGMGKKVGASLNMNREIFMGILNAPSVVAEALKTAVFSSAIFSLLGFKTFPDVKEDRFDIVQAVKLENKKLLIAFCQGLQKGSPIDSFAKPEPWKMPGYDHEIIMAAGTFTQGASIELTADAPIKEPFIVYIQGSLKYTIGKIGILSGIKEIIRIKENKNA